MKFIEQYGALLAYLVLFGLGLWYMLKPEKEEQGPITPPTSPIGHPKEPPIGL